MYSVNLFFLILGIIISFIYILCYIIMHIKRSLKNEKRKNYEKDLLYLFFDSGLLIPEKCFNCKHPYNCNHCKKYLENKK